jgi:hypothetical protein
MNSKPRSYTFPHASAINPLSHAVRGTSPSRKAVATGNYTPDGKAMYSTVEWGKGERAEYCRTVLNRQPGYQES